MQHICKSIHVLSLRFRTLKCSKYGRDYGPMCSKSLEGQTNTAVYCIATILALVHSLGEFSFSHSFTLSKGLVIFTPKIRSKQWLINTIIELLVLRVGLPHLS